MRILLPLHTKHAILHRPVIYQFQEENRYFSNFWPCHVTLPAEGVLPAMDFDSVEKAYMAGKTTSLELRRAVQSMTSGEAKRFSYTDEFEYRPGYNDEWRLNLMRILVEQKFSIRNRDLLEKLIETKDALIIEGNLHCDNFFGFDLEEGYGHNHLGRIIMGVRNVRQLNRG